MRRAKQTDEGREKVRERVEVEHAPRYKGTRKNTFDLRRMAAVSNLMAIAMDRAA